LLRKQQKTLGGQLFLLHPVDVLYSSAVLHGLTEKSSQFKQAFKNRCCHF